MVKDVRSRGWCFTVNNYDDDDIAYVMSLFEEDTNCKYLIVGFEKGSRTEQPHLQCYVYYTEAKSWKSMKKIMGSWHFEQQKATKNVEAYCYCMEDGDFIEFGERPRQGNRTDLEVIKHDIINGRPMKDIANSYFSQWCQYRRAFDEYVKMIAKDKETQVAYYDNSKVLSQMKLIKKEYVNYYIVVGYKPIDEVASIIVSGQYDYVFIPNILMYDEVFKDDIDFTVY